MCNNYTIWAATWQNQQNACAPSISLDQPGHPPSPIRIFAVAVKNAWALSYLLSAQQRLIRLSGYPGWSESWLGTHSFCWFCHVVAHILYKILPFSLRLNGINISYDILLFLPKYFLICLFLLSFTFWRKERMCSIQQQNMKNSIKTCRFAWWPSAA